MTRTEMVGADLAAGAAYQLLTALVVPRPIGWITTRSVDGIDNIAPFSFSGVVSSAPPMVMYSTVGWKDSSRNARDTGEFIFHLASADLIDQVNLTAVDYPATVDEFRAVGLTKESAQSVRPPRIAESPALMECSVVEVVEHGNCVMVIGEVNRFAIADDCLEDGRPQFHLLNAVGRLGGPEWALPGPIHIQPRVPYEPGMPGDEPAPASTAS
ncbi:flavin reductase family protein [Enemella sp. A6]|uniref:flavin reductase family protein n=1 Tax=Enemella sp. A6 TaxID=3440152 RepID=UPI003EBF2FA1